MGLTNQPARRKPLAEAADRAREARTRAECSLSPPHGGEDELFRDPFADFLPSTR